MVKCFSKCIKLFFSRKKIVNLNKYVCLPYLKFSDRLPETHLFFLFGLNSIKWVKSSNMQVILYEQNNITATQGSPIITHLILTWLQIPYGHVVVAPISFTIF